MRYLLASTLAMVAAAAALQAAAAQPLRSVNMLQQCLQIKALVSDFSGVISLSDHDQPLALVYRGNLANPGSPPIGARTRFNLASMSKMFTAVAVAQLVDARRVGVDDPVGKYVEGLTPEASMVTVRQLLTHSAGLGNFFRPENMDTVLKARTASDLLPLIASDKPAFPAGSRFEYSNSGFALLGILIEKISGMTYGEYLTRYVFDPAGMADSGLEPNPGNTLAIGMTAGPGALKRSAAGGTGNSEKPPLGPAPGATDAYGSSAGGIFSTAEDLQRFAAALSAHKLASAAMTAALTHPEIVVSAASEGHPERDYGFGFGVGSRDGHRWFGHNGGTLGANSEFAVFPDDQWVLSVLSNRDPPAATRLFAYARDLMLHPDLLAVCGRDQDGVLRGTPEAAEPDKLVMSEPPPPNEIVGSTAELPMDISEGIPSIQLKIAGKGSFTVGLDTGAPPGLHFRPDKAAALAGSSVGDVAMEVPGGQTLKLKSYQLNEVQIGAISVKGWMADDGGRLDVRGKKLDAVMGVGSFQGFVVTMDYAAGRFILRKGALPAPGDSGVINFEGPIPRVRVTIGALTLTADIDSGNGAAALAAPEDVAKKIIPNAKWISRGTAHTLAGAVPMFDSPLTQKAMVGSTPLVVSRLSYPSPEPVINIGSRALDGLVMKMDVTNHRMLLMKPKEAGT